MKSFLNARCRQLSAQAVLILIFVIIAGVTCNFLSGCATTVTPVVVQSSSASLDGNVANSGFIAIATNGSYIVTTSLVLDRQALIALYSDKFIRPLDVHDDISAGPFSKDVPAYVDAKNQKKMLLDMSDPMAPTYFLTKHGVSIYLQLCSIRRNPHHK